MRTLLILTIIFVLTLAACAPSETTSMIPLPPTEPPTTPTPTGSNRPSTSLPVSAKIEFHRSGGIQGLDETYVIYSDGRITSGDGGEWQVSRQDVQRLLEQIEQAGFWEAEQPGKIIVPCCDRFSYTLTVSLGEKSHTGQTYDGASDQPAAIQSAVEVVEEFIEGCKPLEQLR